MLPLPAATAGCSGHLSELCTASAENEETAGDYAEAARRGDAQLNRPCGLDFDPDESWDEKKEVYRLSNKIVRTQNVTQTFAVGEKKGLWTTVIAVGGAGRVSLRLCEAAPRTNERTEHADSSILRLRSTNNCFGPERSRTDKMPGSPC